MAYVVMEALGSICGDRIWILGMREGVINHPQTDSRDRSGRIQSVGELPQSASEGPHSLW